ncbi:MAG: alpha/beta hydrolase-fold protein [Acidobacteriota bacterium]
MRESPASAGTIVTLRHESEVLNGNPLGDKNVREVIIYLPPDYNESGSDYPSVYCLSGFAGRGRMQLNDSAFVPNLAERMDRLIAAGTIQPMIVVLPDCFTYYGGSQYINSTATGQYEDYLIQEIVPFVDGLFRTRRDPNARAVMGKSSGGYGSLTMGMRHPDLFGLVASISGDAYFEYCYPGDFAKAFRLIKADLKGFMQRFWENEKKGKGDFAAVNTIAMSACYSPNGSDLDLPFDLNTGEIRADVWNRWLEHDPVRLVEKHVENLRSLSLLYLDAGTRDEYGLDLGARILSRRLTDFNIRHIHEEFDDGHFNVSYRYDRSLELISNFVKEL